MQTELSQLYRSNKAISRELADLTARLTEEIEAARTREATAHAALACDAFVARVHGWPQY